MERNEAISYSNGEEVKVVMGSSSNSNSNSIAEGVRRRSSSRLQQNRNVEEPAELGVQRPDFFSTPGFVNIHRGPRMPRSRRATPLSLTFPASHVPPPPPPPPPAAAAAAREIDLSKLNYLFKKQLKNSDVSALRRMVLPKRDAEIHLPVLESKEGVYISMLDMDGLHDWWFKYRYWPNNSSRMYVLESTGEFVYTHGLETDDYILVYQNVEDGKYVIEARKKEEQDAPRILLNEVVIREPTATDMALSLIDEGMEALYEYNATFMDDTPLDYLGGPITLPSLGINSSTYEAIDNFNYNNAPDF
ncbi:hypothetical protein ABFX02_06G001900 [Erythranthe guttata]